MEGFITTVNGYAWGPAMLVLLLGTGIFLTLGLGFLSLRRLPMALNFCLRVSAVTVRAIYPRSGR
jgi:AGCS family alanine or glycine:cation symporter